jgi:hypothetical protein
MSAAGRNLWLLVGTVFCLMAFLGILAFIFSVII